MSRKPKAATAEGRGLAGRTGGLAERIAAADIAYHGHDAPEVTDADYDGWRRRYAEIVDAHPDLADPESAVGGGRRAPASGFAKWRHGVPMLSLDNAFAAEDFVEFEARIRRFLGLKADSGLAISWPNPSSTGCRFRSPMRMARLIAAATRGDGFEGEEVTANIRTLANVPESAAGRPLLSGSRSAARC